MKRPITEHVKHCNVSPLVSHVTGIYIKAALDCQELLISVGPSHHQDVQSHCLLFFPKEQMLFIIFRNDIT